MKLILVPPKEGLVWVRRGFQVFFRQPLGFASLFAVCALVFFVLLRVPFVGEPILLVIAPVGSLLFMIASRLSAAGERPVPGAFVELAKGTDGLQHISNVSPRQRVESVEDVLNRGDEINVRVVEVDRERGRIGLRLSEDPDVAGKSVQELAGVGTGGGGGGGSRPPRDGGGRNGREGARDRGAGRSRSSGERGSGRPRHGGSDRS